MRKKLSNYISLREAQEYCSYSQEYLSLRARQGQLKAIKIGRNWATRKEWVKEYLTKVKKLNRGAITRRRKAPTGLLNKENKRNKLEIEEIVSPVRDYKCKKKTRSKQISNGVKEVFPPDNLPIGQFSEPIQNLFAQSKKENSVFFSAFLFILVCVLLISGGFLNKTHLQEVFGGVSPYFQAKRGIKVLAKAGSYACMIGNAGDIIIKEGANSVHKSFVVTFEKVENRTLTADMIASLRDILRYDLDIFEEYWYWVKHQILLF